MKFQKQERTFQPITITIESVEEMKVLWHRLNGDHAKPIDFKTRMKDQGAEQRDTAMAYEWWDELDEALIGLREK